MAKHTREQMIDGTIELLARGGLAQTSFGAVIELTKTPRGSIYHHFPAGKDQLVAEAVTASGARSITMIEAWRGAPAVEVARRFLGAWRHLLTATEFNAGCAVAAVSIDTESAGTRESAAQVFSSWRESLASLLVDGGVASERSVGVAGMLIAAAEGAVIICRAEQRIDPFDEMTFEVLAHVETVLSARHE